VALVPCAGPVVVPEDLGDLLPSQIRRTAPCPSREHRLAVAVLALAVGDLRGRGPVNANGLKGPAAVAAWRAKMAEEAARWIAADEPHVPFSFVNLCDVLGLDPDGVRRALAGRRAA